MGSWSQAHGCAGMTGIGFEGGIDLCNEDQISLTTSCVELGAEPAGELRLRSRIVLDEKWG